MHNIYGSYLEGDQNGQRVRFFSGGTTNRSFSFSYHPYPDRLTGGLIVERALLMNRSNYRLGFHPFLYQPLNLHYNGDAVAQPWASEFTQGLHIFDGKNDFDGNRVAVMCGQTLTSTKLGVVLIADE